MSISDDKKGPVSNKDIERHPERRFKAALAAFEERLEYLLLILLIKVNDN